VEFDVDPELADNEKWEAATQEAAIEAFVGDEFALERQTPPRWKSRGMRMSCSDGMRMSCSGV
jgi:hypothetical protein